ncbi:hypothetical protein CGZ80_10140 [Rhodopirellula sp. MGV]|nr:hypothetical protein CGZ80_10140 [Rhodopirellula sp. MGV]
MCAIRERSSNTPLTMRAPFSAHHPRALVLRSHHVPDVFANANNRKHSRKTHRHTSQTLTF